MLYFTSDLHYGMNEVGDRATEKLAKHLRGANPGDVLAFAGDLATSDRMLKRCLDLFREFPGRMLAVPGNHDVWIHPRGDATSEERRRLFNQIVRSVGIHPLEEGPIVIGGIGFAGIMGWYDYSFRDEELGIPLAAYERKSYGGVSWSDADFVHWGRTDEAQTVQDVALLERHLVHLAAAEQIVVITHHVPTKQLLVRPRSLVPRRWRFLNAFLGSESLRFTVEHSPAAGLAVCGHVHTAREARINGRLFASIGGSYLEKELVTWNGVRLSRETFR